MMLFQTKHTMENNKHAGGPGKHLNVVKLVMSSSNQIIDAYSGSCRAHERVYERQHHLFALS